MACAKTYQNGTRFYKVIAKMKRCNFWRHVVVTLTQTADARRGVRLHDNYSLTEPITSPSDEAITSRHVHGHVLHQVQRPAMPLFNELHRRMHI